MRITKKQKQTIVNLLTERFPSFGAGKVSEFNPITIWLKDAPAQFAMGVEVEKVVDEVLYLLRTMEPKKKARQARAAKESE